MLERMWREGHPPVLWWECKLVQPLWKTGWRFLWRVLRTLKVELPYDLAIRLLSILKTSIEETPLKLPYQLIRP